MQGDRSGPLGGLMSLAGQQEVSDMINLRKIIVLPCDSDPGLYDVSSLPGQRGQKPRHLQARRIG